MTTSPDIATILECTKRRTGKDAVDIILLEATVTAQNEELENEKHRRAMLEVEMQSAQTKIEELDRAVRDHKETIERHRLLLEDAMYANEILRRGHRETAFPKPQAGEQGDNVQVADGEGSVAAGNHVVEETHVKAGRMPDPDSDIFDV